jgi:hypothetical protein
MKIIPYDLQLSTCVYANLTQIEKIPDGILSTIMLSRLASIHYPSVKLCQTICLSLCYTDVAHIRRNASQKM